MKSDLWGLIILGLFCSTELDLAYISIISKNGKYGQKYVCTVNEITLPPHKLHSGARWQMKYIGHRYLFLESLNLIFGLWLVLN